MMTKATKMIWRNLHVTFWHLYVFHIIDLNVRGLSQTLHSKFATAGQICEDSCLVPVGTTKQSIVYTTKSPIPSLCDFGQQSAVN